MYVNSSRKSKIKANFIDPINAPLVMQLEELLSEPEDNEVQIPEQSSGDYISDDGSDIVDEESSSNSDASLDTESEPESVHIDLPMRRIVKVSKITKSSTNDADDGEDNSDEDTEPVAESNRTIRKNRLNKIFSKSGNSTTKSIKSATNTSSIPANPAYGINSIVRPAEIKGILNAHGDTDGVSKVTKKDNELWIYYNDGTDLNDIMGSAIDVLEASSHSTLYFNRLDRNDNAIVFDIAESDEE